MIIIAGHSHARDVIERDANVAAFAPLVAQARMQDGCIDVAITADSVDPKRSNIIEIWRDEAAWEAWRKVARGPRPRTQTSEVSLYWIDRVKRLV